MMRGAIAAARHEAIEAGEGILAAGGNAADAAVAAAFTAGVAEPYMGGIGGVGDIVVVDAEGKAYAIDCAARAPRGARPDMFKIVGEGHGIYAWPRVEADANIYGPRAAVAPRLVHGLWALHRRFGRMSWSEVVAPAADLAAQGTQIDHFTAAVIAHEMPTLSRDSYARALYYADGFPIKPPLDGNPLTVSAPALRDALGEIASLGIAPLSPGGDIALDIIEVLGSDGVLADADFPSADEAMIRTELPLATIDGWKIFGAHQPSGAITAAMILEKTLAGPREGHPESPARFVTFAAAASEAFAYRYACLSGDGIVPSAGQGAARVTPVATATTHLSAVDENGLAVSLTQSLLSLFGSQVGVSRRGFFMNNGMMWFDPRPNLSASIRPGARALAAMSPMILVSPDGTRRIALGALGARRIITAVAQIAENVIRFGDGLDAAVNRPRIHADGVGPVLADHRLPPGVSDALTAQGVVEHTYFGPTTLNFARAFAAGVDLAHGTFDTGIDTRAASVWNLR